MLTDPRLFIADRPTKADDVVFDVSLEELEDNPYPYYEWMREVCPVVTVPSTGRVLVLTWDLCHEAGTNEAVFGPTQIVHERVYGRPNLMAMTGPEHRALRTAANSPFRPKPIRVIRETALRETASRYIDAIAPRGSADLMLEVLEPISQRVVGDILGFSDLDDATLSRWFHVYADYLVDLGRDPTTGARTAEVKAEVQAYLEERLPPLVENPDQSGLSHLLHDGMPEGRVRSIPEIIGTVGVLIVGGFQEPAHLVGNTIVGLMSRPDQTTRFRADTSRWSSPVVEEGLRWLAPFGMAEKLTTAEIELGGLILPAGTEVALVLGSANRDPARFADPDLFDMTREDQANFSFGFGGHFCIGHVAARNIGQVVMEELFDRLPELQLDPDRAPYVHGWLVRGAKKLPMVWDARPSAPGQSRDEAVR